MSSTNPCSSPSSCKSSTVSCVFPLCGLPPGRLARPLTEWDGGSAHGTSVHSTNPSCSCLLHIDWGTLAAATRTKRLSRHILMQSVRELLQQHIGTLCTSPFNLAFFWPLLCPVAPCSMQGKATHFIHHIHILCAWGRSDMACRDVARESDLEQPLLEGGSKSDMPSSAAQNGHAQSEASEAAESELEAAAPARAAPSVWRDPVLPATLAAVLCLWVLKLVQQGYVDGAFRSLPHGCCSTWTIS